MVTEAGKELLRNTINTAKFHNRIIEENEMWKQWELECGLTMMVSDDDIIKKIKKSHQCSKHSRRDKSRSCSRTRHERAKSSQRGGSSNDRWDHSGFKELYPDADVPDKYPSTSVSSPNRHKKKKKKSHRRSNSSDNEIYEEFKRPVQMWDKDNTLKLIELLRDAPALWNINYPANGNRGVKLREIERIASKFNVDEREIKEQIEFLINEFHKEHKKINGNGSNYFRNEWFAYKHLTFLAKNKNESFKKYRCQDQILEWLDSSDSYSDSEDETFFQPSRDQACCLSTKVQAENSEQQKKANDVGSDLPYLQAYLAQKDSFSVFGEIVAHRLREAKKSNKAVTRAEIEIDLVLQKYESGFFDPPEETFK